MDMTLPQGVDTFLAQAGWSDARIEPLVGDASFRRYFRIRNGARSAMLMDAPPPMEDTAPFLHVAHWLNVHGMRAPEIYAEDRMRGLVLLEDFGNDRMRDYLEKHPDEENAAYSRAIDALVELHRLPSGPFEPYSMDTYQREAALLPEWYAPAAGIDVDADSYGRAWEEVLAPMIARQSPGVTVLRDYHAENIMFLGQPNQQGLIDFQDALVGHPAYDLVSLLQDARRDVAPKLERRMIEYYRGQIATDEAFEADYARLGAQRNAKIVGIFARLWKRDGKPRYLDYIPRVWTALERDLAHPALQPVARWFDSNIPADIRGRRGAVG